MRFHRPIRSIIVWLIIFIGVFLVVPALSVGQTRSSAAVFSPGRNAPFSNGLDTQSSSNFENNVPPVSVDTGSSINQPVVGSSPLTYHGGPVQHIQYAYAIFWLPAGYHYEPAAGGNDTRFESLISRYFNDVSDSNISQLIVQYPDDINASPSNTVVFGGGFVDTDPYPASGTQASPLTGQEIGNEIKNVIASGSLPTGVDDTYYVFTANGINVCEDSAMTMCTFPTTQLPSGLCAYHSYLSGNPEFPYALLSVEPSGITGGCQIPSSVTTLSPNGDMIADSEISLVSQEQVDIQTDPLLTSWYDAVNSVEMSDKCAGQYGAVNTTDGHNVVLEGDEYLIQEEWSNAAGACTLTPPETAAITVTLDPYGSSNGLTSSNYFPLSYAIGKQLFVVQYVSGPMLIQADPNTSLSIGPTSSGSNSGLERWCLDIYCQGDVISLGTSTSATLVLSYYDVLEQNVYEATSDNSQPTTFATLTYVTAPSTMGFGTPDVSVSLSLESYSQYIWVLRDTEASVTAESYPVNATTQIWTNPAASWNITQAFDIPLVISYHQYAMNFTYSVLPSGGMGLTGPSVSFESNGVSNSTTAPSLVWADAGSSYSFSSLLGSSTGSERWISLAGSGSGKVTGAANVSNAYYDQVQVGLSYSVAGSGESTSNAPIFTGTTFGSTLSVPLNGSSDTFWLDRNSSYTVTNILPGSNSTDRWITIQNSSGSITAPVDLDFLYYHEYSINFSYTIVGGGSPLSLPSVNYLSINGTSSLLLSNSPSPVWVNAGSALNVSSLMMSQNSTERWAYFAGSQVASAPGTFQITLYHQYEVGFNIAIIGGGSPSTQPGVSAISFGKPIVIQPTSTTPGTNSTNSSATTFEWLDAGSSYSLPSSLGSTPAERWLTLTNASGVINSAQTVFVTYYNQYQITLQYSVTNGADPSGGPSASIVLFGNPETIVVNQTAGQVWADANSTVSLPSSLPGSNSNERWATNSTVTGAAGPSLSLSPSYDHQFMVTLNTSPASIPVALSEQSGWYDSSSSLVVQFISGKGWSFEGWAGQGAAAYSGTEANLLLTVTSPITETANFYTALTITAPSSGSVTYSFANETGTVGTGQSKIVYVPPGQPLSMSATPFPVFFAFSSWQGNLTSGPNATTVSQNPLTFSVSSPSAVAVYFKINILGIIIVAIVVIVAVASVLMLRRRNRPAQEEYAEEYAEGETLETVEGSEGT